MKILKYTSFFLLFLLFQNVNAQSNKSVQRVNPKLVVTIVVEQMRSDFIQRYWSHFGNDGFKRLVNEGVSCNNTTLNYVYSQSAPGFASIATGATPSVHGIVSDKWYISVGNRKMYSTVTGSYFSVGTSGSQGMHIPKNMMSSTYSDEFRLFNPESKVLSVGLDAPAAVFLGGHNPDAAYWLDDKTGNWISSSYYIESLPEWVNDFNNKGLQRKYLNQIWSPLKNIETYKQSRTDNTSYETGYGSGVNVFPYDLAAISHIKQSYSNFSYLNKTPFGNNYTKDFAIEGILKEDLGKDENTDFLMLNFTSNKFIGDNFGPYSKEMQDTYLRLDQQLAEFLDFLDSEIGKENVLVILTSNHGLATAPKYLEEKRIPNGIFKNYYALTLLKSYMNSTYGKGDWVKMYFNKQIYLNRVLIDDSKLNLEEVQQKVADFMIPFDGIANAVTASNLLKSEFSSGIFQKMQNSYNQNRSGDVMLNLKPGWIDDVPTTTCSNSPYFYDAHIPLIWYGWEIKHQENNEDLEITDIAATISSLLGISKPSGCMGKVIKGLLK